MISLLFFYRLVTDRHAWGLRLALRKAFALWLVDFGIFWVVAHLPGSVLNTFALGMMFCGLLLNLVGVTRFYGEASE